MVKKNRNTGKIITGFIPVIIAVLVFISTRIAIKNPSFVEKYYSEGVYPFLARILSSVSSLFPFSVWDIFWIIAIVLLLTGLFMVVFKKTGTGKFFLRVVQVIAILYSWLYISWGYNYFRPDIHTRLGWSLPETDEAEFRSVLDTIIFRANATYMKFDSSGYSEIDSLIELSYSDNSQELGIEYPNGVRRCKRMIFNSLMEKMGIYGYFGPFFNEVHLTSNGLPFDFPAGLAHEKAHQFGISSEAEANLFSFVICSTSDDKRLQYSGYMIFLTYFLNDASHLEDYMSYLKKIDNRVINDIHYRQIYYKGLQNKTLDKAQSVAYDAYLKTNHIKSGIKNYDEVTALIISWYRNSGRK